MGSKSISFASSSLKLWYQNVDDTGIGDAGGLRGSVAPGSLFCALHHADPGPGGTQATNEVAYGGYTGAVRAALVRSPSGWTVVGNEVSNAAALVWPACSSGSAVATHVTIGVGDTVGQASRFLHRAVLNPPLTIVSGYTPRLEIGELIGVEE